MLSVWLLNPTLTSASSSRPRLLKIFLVERTTLRDDPSARTVISSRSSRKADAALGYSDAFGAFFSRYSISSLLPGSILGNPRDMVLAGGTVALTDPARTCASAGWEKVSSNRPGRMAASLTPDIFTVAIPFRQTMGQRK